MILPEFSCSLKILVRGKRAYYIIILEKMMWKRFGNTNYKPLTQNVHTASAKLDALAGMSSPEWSSFAKWKGEDFNGLHYRRDLCTIDSLVITSRCSDLLHQNSWLQICSRIAWNLLPTQIPLPTWLMNPGNDLLMDFDMNLCNAGHMGRDLGSLQRFCRSIRRMQAFFRYISIFTFSGWCCGLGVRV